MSFRKSFSGFRKKVKDKLSKIGGKIEEIRANPSDDGFRRASLSLQSEPGIIVEDESEGDPEASRARGGPRPGRSLFVSRSAAEIGHGQAASGSSRKKRIAGGEQTERADLHQPDVEKETTPAPFIFRARGSESM